MAKKPVLQYVVEELEANGVRQIVFIAGRSKTSIENHFDFDHELMRNLREGGKEDLLAKLEYERMRMQFLCGRPATQDARDHPSRQHRRCFERLSDLVSDVKLSGYHGELRLIKAALERFAEYCGSTLNLRFKPSI